MAPGCLTVVKLTPPRGANPEAAINQGVSVGFVCFRRFRRTGYRTAATIYHDLRRMLDAGITRVRLSWHRYCARIPRIDAGDEADFFDHPTQIPSRLIWELTATF